MHNNIMIRFRLFRKVPIAPITNRTRGVKRATPLKKNTDIVEVTRNVLRIAPSSTKVGDGPLVMVDD
jgi:hypothetical protein